MSDYSEEIRELCNKHGAPLLFHSLCELLGLDEDYQTESSESEEDVSDDDIVGEAITVTEEGGFFTMVDAEVLK